MAISFNKRLVPLVVSALLAVTFFVASTKPASAATQCYRGSWKGLVYSGGSWHHYVEFPVNVSMADQYWYIQSRPFGFPFGASLWSGYYAYHRQSGPPVYKEMGYNWPGTAWDPYSASSWVICHR